MNRPALPGLVAMFKYETITEDDWVVLEVAGCAV
jgi:hypothetical protein